MISDRSAEFEAMTIMHEESEAPGFSGKGLQRATSGGDAIKRSSELQTGGTLSAISNHYLK